MRSLAKWIFRILSYMFTASIGQGSLLYLKNEHQIVPAEWISGIIGVAIDSNASDYIWWVIVGLSGCIGLITWLVLEYLIFVRNEKHLHSNFDGQLDSESRGSIGFRARGGTITDSSAIGADIGFDTVDTKLVRNVAIDGNSAHRIPPPSGEFNRLTNDELKLRAIKLSEKLIRLGGICREIRRLNNSYRKYCL